MSVSQSPDSALATPATSAHPASPSPSRRDRKRPRRRPRRRGSGDYGAFLGRALRRTLRAAAAEPELVLEIGVIRIALIYLLRAESDLTRLANGIARLCAVSVQAARVRQSLAATELAAIPADVAHVLDQLDREHALTRLAARRSCSHSPEPA